MTTPKGTWADHGLEPGVVPPAVLADLTVKAKGAK